MAKNIKQKNRSTVIAVIAAIIICALVFCSACSQNDDNQISIDEHYGSEVHTTEEIKLFFEQGLTDKVVLCADIDIGNDILNLSEERKQITVEGNGFTLKGSSDCVIRLENNTSLVLNDITVTGECDVIGCMENAELSGKGAVISAHMFGVRCGKKLTIGENSGITVKSSDGNGIMARTIYIEENAKLSARAKLSALQVLREELVIGVNSSVDAVTESDYSAVKCTGTLVLNDGAVFTVKNEDSYHGAQADYIVVGNDVTINADGGDKGAGIFLFQLEDDIEVSGHCSPPLRKENGNGSIKFKGE